MKVDLLKTLGIVGTIGGVAATLLSSWVGNKQMEVKIDNAVTKRLAELSNK